MKIIRPMTVNNGNLSSSNVTEADYAAYNPATTYGLAERAILVSPAATVTISVASPGVVSWTAHGQPEGTPVVFSTTGALPTGIVAGRRYYVRNPATDTFRLSEAVGGVEVVTTGTQSGTHTATAQVHKIYESLQAGNIGHYPSHADSATWWLDLGATNRWKMFDGAVQSQTTNADSIDVDILADGRVDSVALLNVSAASATVTMTDATDGVVFNETYPLVSDSGITDWYAYFFEAIVRLQDLVVDGLPPYANATIGVTLTDTGNIAKCGAMVLGFSKELGGAQFGLGVGITDYSVKQQDDFGNYTILERAFRKTSDMALVVQNSFIDQLQILLAQYRATPIVYVGVDDYGATVIYGFFKEFVINITYVEESICTLSLEGLT